MCGFCGYISSNNILDEKTITDMTNTIKKRGPNAQNTFIYRNVALGHTRLSIIDVKYGNQPMTKNYNNTNYTIVYNGELYNTDILRDNLTKKGYKFTTKCDTEVVLVAYLEYGNEFVNYLNGIFSFAIYNDKDNSIFLARDRLGIKPLFYYLDTNPSNPLFIFASEIKAILKHPDVTPIMDKQGLMELIGLGPAHTPGLSYFKNIKEIKAGYYSIIKDFKINEEQYWDLKTKECYDSEEETISNIHDLVVDATKKQLVSDVGICSMLSGGLDSSILSKIAKDNISDLTTFSIDYIGNDQNFISNEYQLTKDSDYVKIMQKFLNTTHKTVLIENTQLFELLNNSLIARDMPGMADIDSSMFAFCNKINKAGFKVCLSGECSDEIFGGYPWYYKEHLCMHDGFPWALSENLRDNLIKKGILKKGELREYVETRRQETLKNVEVLNNDEFENRFRRINYLTIKWFMNTLVERTDRMSMANSLEVRVPFADHRIFEYVYNVPARLKLGMSKTSIPTEKYLLRKAFEKELPNDIVYRKKSPFPKTYDPKYLKLVECKMQSILNNKDSKILKIINKEYIQSILEIHGENLTENLFGQLMTYPQTLAYLIQIENWLNLYNIELEL